MNISRVLVVGIGGFLGAVLRYLVTGATSKYFGDFPLGTLLVNVVGGLLIGFIMEAGTTVWPLPADLRLFMTTGILGGLTTFSTFSYETVSYLTDGRYLPGFANAALNLFLALFACWAGRAAAQTL
jgi:CrcB protein